MRAFNSLALLLLLLVASCTAPEPGVHKAGTLEEAKSLAAENGGLIILDFWRDG